ncbi:hypothetical protein D3C75_883620 [compost metagenome]
MKKYKIVQHYLSPDDYMFRIYKRYWLFFWERITSYNTLEQCEKTIHYWEEARRAERLEIANTPASKVVKYLG